MARKKKNSPLDDVFDTLGYQNPEGSDGVTDLDNPDLTLSPESNVDDLDNIDDPTEKVEDHNVEDPNNNDDTIIPQEVLDNINKQNNSSEDNEPEDGEEGEDGHEDNTNTVEPWESNQVGAFFDAFADELGWDVDDNDKPQSISDLVEYIGDMVEQNSTPQYADQRIAQLDEYVKNGGRFEDFYNNQSQTLSYENMDMEDESNQRAVVRDYMKLQGYEDDVISRKIERYEDADMLADEADEALSRLTTIREHQLQEQQAYQERIHQQQEAQAVKFMNDLNAGISNLSDIRGIAVPKEDRKALYDYITKTDADGLTQYQKDFNGNMVNNLIESAYFTMKGDALLGTAKKNGQTTAAERLRTMMRHQAKNHSSYNVQDEKQPQAWEIASRYL